LATAAQKAQSKIDAATQKLETAKAERAKKAEEAKAAREAKKAEQKKALEETKNSIKNLKNSFAK